MNFVGEFCLYSYSYGKWIWHPFYISPIWWLLWEIKKYLWNISSLLSRSYVNNKVKIFPKSTVDLCWSKSYKIKSFQSLRFEKDSAICQELNHTHVAQFWVLDDWFIFKVWRTITLQAFDLQGLTICLWKFTWSLT